MKHFLALVAVLVMFLSGCSIAEQARDMTPEEKVAAVQIAEAAGFTDPPFVSKRSDIFGGNYQESISFSMPSGTNDPYSLLVEPYRNIVNSYPGVEWVRFPGGKDGNPAQCVMRDDELLWCAFMVIVRAHVNGDDLALLVRLTANSNQRVGMSFVPYHGDDDYQPYPAPTQLPGTYSGNAL